MEFIWAIIAGLIIGVIARLLRPGKQDIPLWLTILIGMAGAIIGNLLASAYSMRPTIALAFCRQVGLPADRPFILYVCSALFRGSPVEERFVLDWIRHILQIAIAIVLIGLVEPVWHRRRVGRT